MNIQSAIKEGINILKSKYIETAQLDSEILMAKLDFPTLVSPKRQTPKEKSHIIL